MKRETQRDASQNSGTPDCFAFKIGYFPSDTKFLRSFVVFRNGRILNQLEATNLCERGDPAFRRMEVTIVRNLGVFDLPDFDSHRSVFSMLHTPIF